ncbi:c-type cytochrome [Comamonas badia]|uniref:c-type cytochrome n=1 Tax=Comamonas badia TaxID=265291 RepID=UPI0004049954|nr:c-type cytochrome [Comamonas badia]
MLETNETPSAAPVRSGAKRPAFAAALLASAVAVTVGLSGCFGGGSDNTPAPAPAPADPPQAQFLHPELVGQGQDVFRNDTFGDEAKWTDQLKMNQVIEAAVDPLTAASVGVKVDLDALPAAVAGAILAGDVPLDNPQSTLALLELNAVVGIRGQVSTDAQGKKHLDRVGITCALCHSTVSREDLPGPIGAALKGVVGHRLDGHANRDLNPGAIIALSPALAGDSNKAARAQLNSWGPGKYDPRWNFDGISNPTVIPPAYGLATLTKAIFTGDADAAHEPAGPVAYWNRYVSVTQMGGIGTFSDSRLQGKLGGYHDVDNTNGGKLADRVTGVLPALQAYQYSLPAPKAIAGSFDPAAAARGQAVFSGAANCASCHAGEAFTDATQGKLHPAEGTSVANDQDYVKRSATQQWRTSPLPGIGYRASLGEKFFHDGSADNLAEVVDMYDTRKKLGLTAAQKTDLVEYLKSL